MKLNLILFAVLVLLGGYGNAENKPDLPNTSPEKDPLESAVEWFKIQDRNGDAYIPNTDKPYSGWAKKTFENGQIEMLVEFTDGTVTRLQQWQESGIPKLDIGYMKGKVRAKDVPIDYYADSNESLHSGTSISWYENGQKEREVNFKEGKLDGLCNVWHPNGQKWQEVNWKDGKEIGLATEWYENEQKESEENFKDGKLDGLLTIWYENGVKSGEVNYKDGKKHGLQTEWDEDGSKFLEVKFKLGEVDGEPKFF